ncbi:methionine synthase [Rhodobacteraceae bacterium D3-12]|nr:methionine synthase [Rhodobacteraceae bacterium D3-12]
MKARRFLRVFLFVLAALFAAAWVMGYLYVSGMACAYRPPTNNSCNTPMPWELQGHDFEYMVLTPLAILLALLFAGWLVGRKPRS